MQERGIALIRICLGWMLKLNKTPSDGNATRLGVALTTLFQDANLLEVLELQRKAFSVGYAT